MPQGRTLIAAAVFVEVKPLVRRLRLARSGDHAWQSDRVTLVLTGMGAARAASAVARLIDESQPAAVWSVGVAGALQPDLRIGDLVKPAAVIDAATGERFAPTIAVEIANANAASSGSLLTAAALASTVADKQSLRHRFAADAVDMETAAIARLCVARGVGWLSIRTISDTADDAIPPALADMVDPAGQPAVARIVRWALANPRRIGTLLRLGRNTSRAAASLADAVVAALR